MPGARLVRAGLGGRRGPALPPRAFPGGARGEAAPGEPDLPVPGQLDDELLHPIIDSVYCRPAPRRLTLGSDAYASVRAALVERLAALDAQRAIALSTDAEDALPAPSR